jgi:WD40 repeat protein
VGLGSGYTIEAIGQQKPSAPATPDLFEQFVTDAGSAASMVGSVPALLASGAAFGGMALSPDGKLALSLIGTKAFLWDVPTGNLSVTFDARSAPLFSPDGSLIAYGIAGGTAIARTSAPDTALSTVTGNLAAFSPDGRMVATVADTMGMLWSLDPATIGQPLQTLWGNPSTGHTGSITALAFTADNGTVATAGADRAIKLWRVSDGGLIKDLAIPTTSPISSLLFSLDATRIIGAGDSYVNAIYAWDVASGTTQMVTLVPTNGHSPPIFSAGRDAVLVDVPDQISRFATADLAPLAPIALPGTSLSLRSSDDGRTIATVSSLALLLWCAP